MPAHRIETWTSMEQVPHERIRELALHWDARRAGRRAPSRDDIEPLELGRCLPSIFLLEVQPDMRFYIRLVGTHVAEALGKDSTGRLLDEVMPPAHYAWLHEEMTDVVLHFSVRYRIADMAWRDRPFSRFHRWMAPLSADQSRVNMIIGMASLIGADEQLPTEPLEARIDVATGAAGSPAGR
jgi:hypothetical protein